MYERESMDQLEKIHLILYVADQSKATAFYSSVFNIEPALNVPGMTEFAINDSCILGLMPETGIKKLLGEKISDPASASGIPRAELYLRMTEPQEFFQRAISAGGRELSPILQRDWGDVAGYIADLDGHVVAFAGARSF